MRVTVSVERRQVATLVEMEAHLVRLRIRVRVRGRAKVRA